MVLGRSASQGMCDSEALDGLELHDSTAGNYEESDRFTPRRPKDDIDFVRHNTARQWLDHANRPIELKVEICDGVQFIQLPVDETKIENAGDVASFRGEPITQGRTCDYHVEAIKASSNQTELEMFLENVKPRIETPKLFYEDRSVDQDSGSDIWCHEDADSLIQMLDWSVDDDVGGEAMEGPSRLPLETSFSQCTPVSLRAAIEQLECRGTPVEEEMALAESQRHRNRMGSEDCLRFSQKRIRVTSRRRIKSVPENLHSSTGMLLDTSYFRKRKSFVEPRRTISFSNVTLCQSFQQSFVEPGSAIPDDRSVKRGFTDSLSSAVVSGVCALVVSGALVAAGTYRISRWILGGRR